MVPSFSLMMWGMLVAIITYNSLIRSKNLLKLEALIKAGSRSGDSYFRGQWLRGVYKGREVLVWSAIRGTMIFMALKSKEIPQSNIISTLALARYWTKLTPDVTYKNEVLHYRGFGIHEFQFSLLSEKDLLLALDQLAKGAEILESQKQNVI